MKTTLYLTLALLIMVGVPAIISSQTICDRPPVTSPAPRVELAAFEAKVAEMTKVLPVYSARFTCKLEVFDPKESEITEDDAKAVYASSYLADVEVSVVGDRYRYKFITPDKVVEELNNGVKLMTLTFEGKKVPRMTEFLDRSRGMDPIFGTPTEEIKAALMPGINIANVSQFTHHEKGLSTKIYPTEEAYISISADGWVAVYVDKNGLPVQIWWGGNHSPGYSFSSYSNWEKDDTGRLYPSHVVEKFWLEGKWFSQVTIDIAAMSQNFDQKKAFEEIIPPEGTKKITH